MSSENKTAERADWLLVQHNGAAGHTDRLSVPGGWLYRHVIRLGSGRDSYESMSIAFVPEPSHHD